MKADDGGGNLAIGMAERLVRGRAPLCSPRIPTSEKDEVRQIWRPEQEERGCAHRCWGIEERYDKTQNQQRAIARKTTGNAANSSEEARIASRGERVSSPLQPAFVRFERHKFFTCFCPNHTK